MQYTLSVLSELPLHNNRLSADHAICKRSIKFSTKGVTPLTYNHIYKGKNNTNVFFILIWRMITLYIQYNLVKAKSQIRK